MLRHVKSTPNLKIQKLNQTNLTTLNSLDATKIILINSLSFLRLQLGDHNNQD